VYPIVLGLDRIETASLLRSNGTFQYLTGLAGFPDPQTLRRFLRKDPTRLWEQLHRVNDRVLQGFIHRPERRSRLIFDLDSTVVTVFGKQDGAEVWLQPPVPGQAQLQPVAMSGGQQFLSVGRRTTLRKRWTWEGRPPSPGYELRERAARNPRACGFRADAGFGYDPVFEKLEAHRADYAVVARLTDLAQTSCCRGCAMRPPNACWDCGEGEFRGPGLAASPSHRVGALCDRGR